MSPSNRTPTGTKQKAAGSLRTQGKDSLGQLAKRGSTNARPSVAWSDTPATGTTTPLGSCPVEAPNIPRVDLGPKAYKTYKSGARAVIRFFVWERRKRFYVCDMCSSRQYAAKTSPDGYATEKEAVRIARQYRDEYGAYAKAPF